MSYDRAAADPKFLQMVIDNVSSDKVPDMTAWPYSESTYVALKRQIRSVMTPKTPKITAAEFNLQK